MADVDYLVERLAKGGVAVPDGGNELVHNLDLQRCLQDLYRVGMLSTFSVTEAVDRESMVTSTGREERPAVDIGCAKARPVGLVVGGAMDQDLKNVAGVSMRWAAEDAFDVEGASYCESPISWWSAGASTTGNEEVQDCSLVVRVWRIAEFYVLCRCGYLE